jgi:hypothetical protein
MLGLQLTEFGRKIRGRKISEANLFTPNFSTNLPGVDTQIG